jgi:hypothetical protein
VVEKYNNKRYKKCKDGEYKDKNRKYRHKDVGYRYKDVVCKVRM